MKKILLLTTCLIFIGTNDSFAQTAEKKREKAEAVPVSTKLESPVKLKPITPKKEDSVSVKANKEGELNKVEAIRKEEK